MVMKRFLALALIFALLVPGFVFAEQEAQGFDADAFYAYLDGLSADELVQMHHQFGIYVDNQWRKKHTDAGMDGQICFSTPIIIRMRDASLSGEFDARFIETTKEQHARQTTYTDVWAVYDFMGMDDGRKVSISYTYDGESSELKEIAYTHERYVNKNMLDDVFYLKYLCGRVRLLISGGWSVSAAVPEYVYSIDLNLQKSLMQMGAHKIVGAYTVPEGYGNIEGSFTIDAEQENGLFKETVTLYLNN